MSQVKNYLSASICERYPNDKTLVIQPIKQLEKSGFRIRIDLPQIWNQHFF
jgi:hypothetical protein